MCAIAGIIGMEPGDWEAMLATMVRRGPDAKGIHEAPGCLLLHARLAVIDPEGGGQPMTRFFAGEQYTIVYNGELYNTRELRKELESLGHVFQDQSDTEVLLCSYIRWGKGCLEKLNGIFAFAVWEHRRKRLFLARDRMGVKPLFYWQQSGGLVFASEIKTILAHGSCKPRLDVEGAAEILLLGPGRSPDSGVFYGIQALEPGCCGWWEKGKLRVSRYWQLRDRVHRDSLEETAEKVRYLVTDAIRRQTVSDVPVGTFLSGGLDSSLITSVCALDAELKGKSLPTFSVDYVDNEKYFTPNKFQPNSDGYYIRKMQQVFGTDHHWCILSPEDLLAELENATMARDLPGMADVDFSLLAFCRQIRENVTVALSGECADEIFGGYPWYRDPQIRDQDGFPWAQNTALRCQLLSPELSTRLDGEDYVRQRYLDTCRGSDILPGTDPTERRMKEMVNLNLNWFMQTLLDRKDRMSMYSALEVRVPFCDYRIAEYLYGVPWEMKDLGGREKGLLRYAMRDYLPEEVLYRKKSPYPKTFHPRYLEAVTQRMKTLLEEKDAPIFALVRKEELQKMLESEPVWPWYGQLMRQSQTLAYFLQLDFWLRHNQVEILW